MSLLPEEKRYYGQLFKVADEGGEGIINGGLAVKFFERSGLPAETLGLIWEISDKDNSGFLTQQSFSVALRLIGQAQAGRAPVATLAKQPGPYPVFQGIDPPSATTPRSSAPQPPKSRNVVPPLTPEDRAKYLSSWQSVNPSGGLLDGERARDVFQKSRLPVEQLGQIWALTDVRNRGSLDVTEFIVAMHLVQSAMNGSVKTLPSQLPTGLFEAAASGPNASSSRSQRQQSSISSVRSQEPLQQQFSGQRQTVPMRSQLTGPPGRSQPLAQSSPARQATQPQTIQPQMSGQVTESEWDVKPHEKANYDNLFNDLDKSQKGYITGEEAVGFFLQSKLPEDDLAKVWDYSDMEFSGQLNKDTFAVAMHLIKGKLGGKDLPAALPPSLIPPSMRSKMQAPVTAAFAKAQTQPQPLPPSSAAADLFDLNDTFNAPPAQPRSPPAQAFVSDNYGAIDRVASPPVSAPRGPAQPGRSFNGQPAFVPSSTFGQSIQQQNQAPQFTQAPQPGPVASQQPQAPRIERDLMSDVEPEQNRNISNDATEIANLNNQKASLDNQTRQIQQERGQTSGDISNLHEQKRELNERLVHIRQAYDQEVQAVRAMQAEQGSLRSETRELVKEASLLEASLDAIRQQHESISTQLVKDRTDNSSIKDRIKSANEQTVTLKATLEKVQKDAKQQRGLVAINTKQLNTLEAEHEKLNAQIEQEQAEAEKHRITAIEQERAKANAEQSLSALRSPALSTTSTSTNPFHRIGSPSIDGTRQVNSPFNQIFSQSSTNEPQTSHTPAIGLAAAGTAAFAGAALLGSSEASTREHHNSAAALDNTEKSLFDTDSSAPENTPTFNNEHNTDVLDGGRQSTTTMSGFHNAFGHAGSHDSSASTVLQTSNQIGDDHGLDQTASNINETHVRRNESESSTPVHERDNETNDPNTFSQAMQGSSVIPAESAPKSVLSSSTNPPSYSHGSDNGSVNTSVHNRTVAGQDENSAPSGPLSPVPIRAASPTSRHGLESATNEHELDAPVTSSKVQEVLTRPPNDQIPPIDQSPSTDGEISPQIPGAFPTQEEELHEAKQVKSEDRPHTQAGASSSQTIYHETGTLPQESAAEVDSSDDETIEQPRGADFFSTGHASVIPAASSHSFDDAASIHTITAAPSSAQNGYDRAVDHSSIQNMSSDFPNQAATASVPITKGKEVDDFDEFDDLEEAAEGDEEEFNRSFTTTTNDFDASFEAPSARSSMMPERGSNMFSTPQIALPRHESVQASPERDFSEFAHYGAVLSDDGLAPPLSARGGNIVNSAPVTFGTRSEAAPQVNIQSAPSQAIASPQAVPAPPASRHGATLAPKRPEPARAISAADDPMLIELMDMGFQREKSVSALEQFNYDLGAAMDFLLKGN